MHAYEEVVSVLFTLKSMRERSEQEFNKIYAEANKLGKELHGEDFELSQPELSGTKYTVITFKQLVQSSTVGLHSTMNSLLM